MGSKKGRPSNRQSIRNRPMSQPSLRSRTGAWEDPEMYTGDGEPKRNTQLKNCCRSFATFMCTQIGVGGIIVGYAIVGAFGFIALETGVNAVSDKILENVTSCRNQTASQLWLDFRTFPLNESQWDEAAQLTLQKFQREVVDAVKKGYDGRRVIEQWNFPAALMFTLSIFTMIGFGNLVPKTQWGKVITIFYAVFGIPLYILYFMNMGRSLARTFKWIYIKMNSCSFGKSPDPSTEDLAIPPSKNLHEEDEEENEEVIVPSTASLYVLVMYIAVGTITFAEWESWDYLDSVYFCVTSLCKLGIGDFVPGTNIDDTDEGNQIKLVINFIYLLLGLGLVAMCYNLLREEVRAKLRQLRTDLKDLCFFIKNECSCK